MDEQKIKEAAYALWEKDGKPNGHDLEHWFKASSTIDGDVDPDADGLTRSDNRAGPDNGTIETPVSGSMAAIRKRKNAKE